MQHEKHILTAPEIRRHRAIAVPNQNGATNICDPLSSKNFSENLQLFEALQRTGKQVAEANTNQAHDSQYYKLQNLSNQQAVSPIGQTRTRTATTTSNSATTLTTTTTKYSLGQLLPFVFPQLDEEKAMVLQTEHEKFKKNEITKEQFRETMKDIIKDNMLKLAALEVKAQEGVQKSKIQVQTSAWKPHVGQAMGMPREAQTPELLKRCGAETKSCQSSLSLISEGNTLTSDTQCHIDRKLTLSMNSSVSPSIAEKKALEKSDLSPLSEKQKSSGPNVLEIPDALLQPLRKKQKMSGPSEDQSIEHLNDVTAVSGVNLREEERLLSRPKYQVSEPSLRSVRGEENKLILQKGPLQRKLAEIIDKCGMRNVSEDVERCLSLGVEERMRVFLCNLIRFSKQRVDGEKQNSNVVITSDIHQHLMILNRRAKEELQKQGDEAEKLQKLSEPESDNANDGKKEKDEARGKSRKVNKQEDDKMRTTAANVAARLFVGGDDLLSKWQTMAEQAQKRREESLQLGGKHNHTFGRSSNDRGADRGQALAAVVSGSAGKHGRNQGRPTQPGVSRKISVKDVISVLERETQMSRSSLIFKLYDRVPSNSAHGN